MPESLSEYRGDTPLSPDITLVDLVNAFNSFLERQKYMKPLSTKVTNREFSVTKRTNEIRTLLTKYKRVDFFDLFEELNKPFVVVTFLSVLEMAKNNEIDIKQEKNFSNIFIESRV